MSIIRFEKYKDAGTGNFTELECNSEAEVASAIVNILTNRKKGFPREVIKFDVFEDGSFDITIVTHNTSKKERTIGTVDPTME